MRNSNQRPLSAAPYEKINCAMCGCHLNYVAKSRYNRLHIDCKYIIYLTLVVIEDAVIAKIATNPYHCFTKKKKLKPVSGDRSIISTKTMYTK